MGSRLAILVYASGVLGLFWLDRDRAVRTSRALWIPVMWLLIVGSRSVSVWLGLTSPYSADALAEGSPVDSIVFALLLAAGIGVLMQRQKQTIAVLRANWPLLIYFAYCLVSVLWSDFPLVAFKRWTKAVGELAMVLIVATDPRPVAALARFLARAGFILLPASILLIKYFNDLGRGYDAFTGMPMNTGVTTNKNALGVITLVLSLGALWRVLNLLRQRYQANRVRHLLAQVVLLVFGLALLMMAHSATSGACFALGSILMVATSLPKIAGRPAAIHSLVVVLVVGGGLSMLMGGSEAVVHAMGRQTDLTGRTAIWQAVIPLAPNSLLGAGFESFWLGSRLDALWRAFPLFQPNEAHNGYIEVYLNLGWVGIILIVMILVSGYIRAADRIRRAPELVGLILAYVAAAAMYSVTEAGFRMLNPMWMFLLLAVVTSFGPALRALSAAPFSSSTSGTPVRARGPRLKDPRPRPSKPSDLRTVRSHDA